MKRTIISLTALAATFASAPAWAQCGVGSTAAGSFLAGTAANTRAAGEYNVATSQAAKNYQDAYQHYLENQKLRVQTYFDMRRINHSARAEERSWYAHLTPDQMVAVNQARLPARLSANDIDPSLGVLSWPAPLKRPEFESDRARLDALFAERAKHPRDAGLGTQNCRDVQQAVDELAARLHSEIKQFRPDEYIPCSKFLKSLAYEARTVPALTLASK